MVFRRNTHTAWRTVAGETIVVDLAAKEFFGLNETAAYLWNAFDGTVEAEELAECLGIALAEVAGFAAELQRMGLVEVGEKCGQGRTSVPVPEVVELPCILWREEIRQIAASCAFTPALNPLCIQVPFS